MKKILSAYPDYGKAPPDYIVGFIEAVSYLPPDDIAALTHPTEGLVTRCQYLPTIADVHNLLRERKAKAEQFKTFPPKNLFKYDRDDPDYQEPDYARRRRVVRECLGYNPGDTSAPKRELTLPHDDEVRSLRLKTPAAPITPQLRALLEREGWPLSTQEKAA